MGEGGRSEWLVRMQEELQMKRERSQKIRENRIATAGEEAAQKEAWEKQLNALPMDATVEELVIDPRVPPRPPIRHNSPPVAQMPPPQSPFPLSQLQSSPPSPPFPRQQLPGAPSLTPSSIEDIHADTPHHQPTTRPPDVWTPAEEAALQQGMDRFGPTAYTDIVVADGKGARLLTKKRLDNVQRKAAELLSKTPLPPPQIPTHTSSSQNMFEVRVPDGVGPGEKLQATVPGTDVAVMITVPAGAVPGTILEFPAPKGVTPVASPPGSQPRQTAKMDAAAEGMPEFSVPAGTKKVPWLPGALLLQKNELATTAQFHDPNGDWLTFFISAKMDCLMDVRVNGQPQEPVCAIAFFMSNDRQPKSKALLLPPVEGKERTVEFPSEQSKEELELLARLANLPSCVNYYEVKSRDMCTFYRDTLRPGTLHYCINGQNRPLVTEMVFDTTFNYIVLKPDSDEVNRVMRPPSVEEMMKVKALWSQAMDERQELLARPETDQALPEEDEDGLTVVGSESDETEKPSEASFIEFNLDPDGQPGKVQQKNFHVTSNESFTEHVKKRNSIPLIAPANAVFILLCILMAYNGLMIGTSQTWLFAVAVVLPFLVPLFLPWLSELGFVGKSDESIMYQREHSVMAIPSMLGTHGDRLSRFFGSPLVYGLFGSDQFSVFDAVSGWCWASAFILLSLATQENLKSKSDGSPGVIAIVFVSLEGVHAIRILTSFLRLRALCKTINRAQDERVAATQNGSRATVHRVKQVHGLPMISLLSLLRAIYYVAEIHFPYGRGSGVGLISVLCLLEAFYLKTIPGKQMFCLKFVGNPVHAHGSTPIPLWDEHSGVLSHFQNKSVAWGITQCMTYQWTRPLCNCYESYGVELRDVYAHRGKPARHATLEEISVWAEGRLTYIDWVCLNNADARAPSDGSQRAVYAQAGFHRVDGMFLAPFVKTGPQLFGMMHPSWLLSRFLFPWFPLSAGMILFIVGLIQVYTRAATAHDWFLMMYIGICLLILVGYKIHGSVEELSSALPFLNQPACLAEYLMRQEGGGKSTFQNSVSVKWYASPTQAKLHLLLGMLGFTREFGSLRDPWPIHLPETAFKQVSRGKERLEKTRCMEEMAEFYGVDDDVIKHWFVPRQTDVPIADSLAPWAALTLSAAPANPSVYLAIMSREMMRGRPRDTVKLHDLAVASKGGKTGSALVSLKLDAGLVLHWGKSTLKFFIDDQTGMDIV